MMLTVMDAGRTISSLLCDLARFMWRLMHPHGVLAAENLFLHKQPAIHQERKLRPRRPDTAFRIGLVLLSRLFDWKHALVVIQPQTLVRRHQQGFRLFWPWKSRPGRPAVPIELRRLIREMPSANSVWREQRIANELLFKPGIRVSPRRASKHMPKHPRGLPRGDQRWSTFVRPKFPLKIGLKSV